MNPPSAQRRPPEVRGGTLLGVVEGLVTHGVPPAGVAGLLEAAGLGRPVPEGWYPVDRYLALFAAVEAAHGREAVRAMGRVVPDSARFAPDLQAPERALQVLDLAYQVNHRGGPLGHYHARVLGPGLAEVRCENPYPCDLDRGLLERLMEVAGVGPRARVEHAPGGPCRRRGDRSCLFEVRW